MVKIIISLRFLGNRDRLAVKIAKTPQAQMVWVTQLCAAPHKSAYVEFPVMLS